MVASSTRSPKTKARGHSSVEGQGSAAYEFMGPPGAVAIIIGLPCLMLCLTTFCDEKIGCMRILAEYPYIDIPIPAGAGSIMHAIRASFASFHPLALGVYFLWICYQVLLHLVLPGRWVMGTKLPDGSSALKYKLTARLNFVVTMTLIFFLSFHSDLIDLGWVYRNFIPLMISSFIFSGLLSVYLYARSFRRGALLAGGGNTGNIVYDFFIGRELNPRVGSSFDLKQFCELQPGLIGWVVINVACLHHQWRTLGRITNSMALVNIFQGVYVLDALWFEKAILSTMDITTDGFGFMLAFGDLSWVPFVYTLQARFLAATPIDLGNLSVVGIVALKVLGYWAFRGSNLQKDRFRTDPNHPSVAYLRTMPTSRGTKLIISGWWGMARHINYTADWLMSLAWALPCGISSPVPYFHPIYFAILLIHRDGRDFHACSLKYGKDWERYCKAVPYSLIPSIY